MDESADLKIVAAVCLCVDERERPSSRSSLVEGDEGCIRQSGKLLCHDKSKQNNMEPFHTCLTFGPILLLFSFYYLKSSSMRMCRKGEWAVWPEKIAKCLQKLPKNDFTRKIEDFDNFTKIA